MQRTERLLLAYSPAWIAVITYVMFSGTFKHWGNTEHMLLGIGMALPPWIIAAKGGHALRFVGLVTLYAFIQCWFGSQLFFDLFGMQYHFHVTPRWIWNGTPAFLYFVTVAYFSTYYVVLVICWRFLRRRFPRAQLLTRALLSYAVAFAETATMANQALADYFSYRDPRWVMLYGSIGYGIIFFVTLPQFYQLQGDEKPWPLVRDCLAYNMLILILYACYAGVISCIT